MVMSYEAIAHHIIDVGRGEGTAAGALRLRQS
jgi:hypothetical protein